MKTSFLLQIIKVVGDVGGERPPELCSFPNVVEHHDQRVSRRPEPAWLDRWRAVCGEDLQLFFRVGAQVGFGALDAGMAEPERYFANVAGRSERVHCAGMP